MRLIDADALIANKFKNDISYNAFCSLVKRQPNVNQWHRVEDELPKDGFTGKLVCDNEGQIYLCGGYATITLSSGSVVYTDSRILDVFWDDTASWDDVTHFTHWMPVPDLPKEKEDDKTRS